MGYPADMTSFSAEKLEKLLRHAKVTQQSIQTVSTWILDRRAFLADIVDVWYRLVMEGDANQQIVYLYIANDTMQVGARKFGKHIAEMFEGKLLSIVEYVMGHGEEKVKRCVIKIIGIWKERTTITPGLLQMLQNVCAGKPAVEEVPGAKEILNVDEQVKSQHTDFLSGLESDASVELALQDMPEVIESEATSVMNQRLQNLVSATISADLLSDRMFQLESSLSTFHQATEAFSDSDRRPAENAESKEEDEQQQSSAGDIVWDMLDQQVFDVEVERSREHVQQYRHNLEAQMAERDSLLEHLESLKLLDPFADPMFNTSRLLHDQQADAVARLHVVCLKAEILEKQREAERQAAYKSRAPLIPTSVSPHHSGGADTFRAQTSYSPRSDYYRGEPMSSNSSNSSGQRQPPLLRRFSSSGSADYHRYENDDHHYGDAKRAKLYHSNSLDAPRSERVSRWDQPRQESPRPRDQTYQDRYGGGQGDRYSPNPRQGNHYGGRDDSYRNRHGGRRDSARW